MKIRSYFQKTIIAMVAFTLVSSVILTAMAPTIPGVPYYSQPNWYYCGPACLEMVFDFYGPDIPQEQIADAARTDGTFPDPYGSYPDELRRAAHFSDLSTSAGEGTHVTGYDGRGLGYATFERTSTTIDQLKSLIDAGYPIVVLHWNDLSHDWGHFRVVIGYTSTHIIVHDPLPQGWTGFGKEDTSWGGPDNAYSYDDFNDLWTRGWGGWALFTHPWDVSISSPPNVAQGDTFTVTATITYPCPPPFSAVYPASSSEATIQLPAGLSLTAGETNPKTLGGGTMLAGGSETVQWSVDAGSAGSYSLTVEAEGLVEGTASGHPVGVFTETYDYTDRIGGTSSASVTVEDGVVGGAIQGTVTDADTGLPIMGATVSADGYSTTTDASGFYSFPSVPEGSYDVTAEMTGYVSETASGVAVTADATTVQDFELTPVAGVGTLQGTVTDADTGLPIMGATVSADGYSTTTDASGFYSFPSVPEGSYDVTAEMTGYVSETASGVAVTADATTVQDFALSPVTAAPSIESSDSTGAKKDTFQPNDEVYATGTGYSPSTTYDVYLVEDVTWVDGMAIPPRVAGTTTTVTSDAAGDVPATLLWSAPLVPGKYDIVVDVDGDGLYFAESAALDDNDIEVTAGFLVIPEFWLGTILGLAGCFVAFGVFHVFKRKHQ